MERVTDGITTSGAVLTVDLGALRANYRLLRDRASPASCAAVVKADAYGLGALRVAPALMADGCATFFVATIEEALQLRETLGHIPDIYVLNGLLRGAEAAAARAGILPVLNTPRQVEAWMRLAMSRGMRLPCALHIDTGMARLGLDADDFRAIAADASASTMLDVRLVMSHLARSEEPGEAINALQLRKFSQLAAAFPDAPRSLANSSAVFLPREFHLEMVRPGVSLYGVNPTPGRPNPMRPVLRLDAPVLQVRNVDAGATVGYGSTFTAPRPMTLATIGIGYADGWDRNATIGACFAGRPLPLAGRISMDTLVVDASASDVPIREGDMVEMIGPTQDVDRVAEGFGTLGYEVMARLGARVRRRYLDG